MPRIGIFQFNSRNFRNGAGDDTDNNNQNPLLNAQDHLYHAAFVQLALFYSRLLSWRQRKLIEYCFLFMSLVSLMMLTYIHFAFVRSPVNCLQNVTDWPRNGILRVEILRNSKGHNYSLDKSYFKEQTLRRFQESGLSYFFMTESTMEEHSFNISTNSSNVSNIENQTSAIIANHYLVNHLESDENVESAFNSISADNVTDEIKAKWSQHVVDNYNMLGWPLDDTYIVEYSLEYGFLRMSAASREKLNISVKFVTLDPDVNECFGGWFSKGLLDHFFGYNDVLLASLKNLAEKENYEGYVRNVITENDFIFVSIWTTEKSYITAAFVMMVFTVAISVLLRYSHHQIFLFIVELLHMVDRQSSINVAAAPLLTVILALVGMEAIMSEFFNDTTIAFYIILIVWFADQFDSVLCRTPISKKHWLRFFYLYHFAFYAYCYKFNGHYARLALRTSGLFIMHSMIYFFHNYELPALLNSVGPPEPQQPHEEELPPENPDTNSESGRGDPESSLETSSSSAAATDGSETDYHVNDDPLNVGSQQNPSTQAASIVEEDESDDSRECYCSLKWCSICYYDPADEILQKYFIETSRESISHYLRSRHCQCFIYNRFSNHDKAWKHYDLMDSFFNPEKPHIKFPFLYIYNSPTENTFLFQSYDKPMKCFDIYTRAFPTPFDMSSFGMSGYFANDLVARKYYDHGFLKKIIPFVPAIDWTIFILRNYLPKDDQVALLPIWRPQMPVKKLYESISCKYSFCSIFLQWERQRRDLYMAVTNYPLRLLFERMAYSWYIC